MLNKQSSNDRRLQVLDPPGFYWLFFFFFNFDDDHDIPSKLFAYGRFVSNSNVHRWILRDRNRLGCGVPKGAWGYFVLFPPVKTLGGERLRPHSNKRISKGRTLAKISKFVGREWKFSWETFSFSEERWKSVDIHPPLQEIKVKIYVVPAWKTHLLSELSEWDPKDSHEIGRKESFWVLPASQSLKTHGQVSALSGLVCSTLMEHIRSWSG